MVVHIRICRKFEVHAVNKKLISKARSTMLTWALISVFILILCPSFSGEDTCLFYADCTGTLYVNPALLNDTAPSAKSSQAPAILATNSQLLETSLVPTVTPSISATGMGKGTLSPTFLPSTEPVVEYIFPAIKVHNIYLYMQALQILVTRPTIVCLLSIRNRDEEPEEK